MNAHCVLLACSDAHEGTGLKSALELEGYQVSNVQSADRTVHEAWSGGHDVVLLDSGMKGAVPFQLCRAIRQSSNIGIIILNRDSRHSVIDALNAGADDYVPAPFVMAELLARVRAILRRVVRPAGLRLVLQDRAVDLDSHEVHGPDGQVSRLTPKEFLVLRHLASHPNRPRSHQDLAQNVWQRDASGEVEYMRIVIKQLRRKLEPDPDNPRYILTDRAVGYRFQLPTTESPSPVSFQPCPA